MIHTRTHRPNGIYILLRILWKRDFKNTKYIRYQNILKILAVFSKLKLESCCKLWLKEQNIGRAWLCPWTQLVSAAWCTPPRGVHGATCTVNSSACIYV